VEIHVLQGERPMAADNRTLGRFILDGIPPAPRGVPQIEVTFDVDANGILHVTAKDKATGKEQSIRIEASSGLTEEEVERMKREAQQHAAEDKKRKEEIETKNKADTVIYQTEKQLNELKDKMTPEDKTKLETALGRLKEAHKSGNVEEMKSAMDQVNATWNEIAQRLYSTAGAGATAGQQAGPEAQAGATAGADAGQQQASGDDKKVEDADYEVIDDDKN